MLDIPGPDCGALSPAISVLKQLETLWLADPRRPKSTSGALWLKANRTLHSLKLDGVVPDSIQLAMR